MRPACVVSSFNRKPQACALFGIAADQAHACGLRLNESIGIGKIGHSTG